MAGEHRNLSDLQKEIVAWRDRNFSNSKGADQALGVAEEYFELGQALGPVLRATLKRKQAIRLEAWDRGAALDAIGDQLVYLCCLASDLGIDLQEALDETWEQVGQRDWNAYRREHGIEEGEQ